MATEYLTTNFGMYLNGRRYVGQATELVLPKLVMKMVEYRAGGMDAPLKDDMGMEALDASFTIMGQDPTILEELGITQGAEGISMTFKANLRSSDRIDTPLVIEMRGMISELDQGTFKSGEQCPLKVKMDLKYFKQSHNGKVLHEIEPDAMKRIINGKDLLSAERTNIGF